MIWMAMRTFKMYKNIKNKTVISRLFYFIVAYCCLLLLIVAYAK